MAAIQSKNNLKSHNTAYRRPPTSARTGERERFRETKLEREKNGFSRLFAKPTEEEGKENSFSLAVCLCGTSTTYLSKKQDNYMPTRERSIFGCAWVCFVPQLRLSVKTGLYYFLF